MTNCAFCERECDEDRDLWSDAADSFIHKRCLTWRLKRRKEYDACLHRIAREFGMAKAAPGRKALECRNGHAYTAANTYVDGMGCQQCRQCSRLHHRRYMHQHADQYRAMRQRSGKSLGIIVKPSLYVQVKAAAAAADLPLSAFVRGVLAASLVAAEEQVEL